jgi:chromosome segregation ATPase
LQIPSAQLESAVTELKQLGRVDQETQSGEEVTKEFTDRVARLKNARATEQRLLDVLREHTGKVKDILDAEQEIARVRGEIEQMEADQRSLQTRIDFATVQLSVQEEYKASLQSAPPSTARRLRNAGVEGYRSLVESVIGIGVFALQAVPILLLWGIILFLPARWMWKRIRRTAASQS